jgi:uncharacterized protein YjeT (DUF2065 family)
MMKPNRVAKILSYLADTLRMIGVASFMTSTLSIVFSRSEATEHPATVSILLVIGLILLVIGTVLCYYSAAFDEEE